MKLKSPGYEIHRREDRRGYETPQGTMPSVTTILGATSSPESKARLEAWLARPGSAQESARACKRGSWVHEQLENHLSGLPVQRHLAFNGYLQSMLPWVEANILEPIAMELPIWHPAGFSGTFDLLAFTDDSPHVTLIDWKTSKRPRSADLVENYAQQLAAYRLGLTHTYDVTPMRGILVIGRPASSRPDVWTYEADELDRREDLFLERVRQYQAPPAYNYPPTYPPPYPPHLPAMTPRAFETLIEIDFTDSTSAEFFYQQQMTEPEVHDTIDALMEEHKEFSSPIHVSHWNGGNIYSQEIRLLSPTE